MIRLVSRELRSRGSRCSLWMLVTLVLTVRTLEQVIDVVLILVHRSILHKDLGCLGNGPVPSERPVCTFVSIEASVLPSHISSLVLL
jgi:hypothetical protein